MPRYFLGSCSPQNEILRKCILKSDDGGVLRTTDFTGIVHLRESHSSHCAFGPVKSARGQGQEDMQNKMFGYQKKCFPTSKFNLELIMPLIFSKYGLGMHMGT